MTKIGKADASILEIGATYVAKNYAWLALGFWWKVNNMNERVKKGADILQVSRCVNGGTGSQYKNWYPNGWNDLGWNRQIAYKKVLRFYK